jgi:hypothetical protein
METHGWHRAAKGGSIISAQFGDGIMTLARPAQ